MSGVSGRFNGRDPSGFVDGTSVYGYLRNRGLSKIDPAGIASCAPNWTGPCTLANFRPWFVTETAERNTWLPKLRPCPCTLSCKDPPFYLCGVYINGGGTHHPCPTPPPGFAYVVFDVGQHLGRDQELRENNCPDDCQPGNQCIYKSDGNLATTAPAVGTADRYSGGCGAVWSSNHVQSDYYPYDCAKRLDPTATIGLIALPDAVRPTNGGKPCVKGPWQR